MSRFLFSKPPIVDTIFFCFLLLKKTCQYCRGGGMPEYEKKRLKYRSFDQETGFPASASFCYFDSNKTLIEFFCYWNYNLFFFLFSLLNTTYDHGRRNKGSNEGCRPLGKNFPGATPLSLIKYIGLMWCNPLSFVY